MNDAKALGVDAFAINFSMYEAAKLKHAELIAFQINLLNGQTLLWITCSTTLMQLISSCFSPLIWIPAISVIQFSLQII